MCIVVANVFHQLADCLHVGRQKPFGHIVSQEVAQQTPKIFVTNKRQQRPRPGRDTYGTPQ